MKKLILVLTVIIMMFTACNTTDFEKENTNKENVKEEKADMTSKVAEYHKVSAKQAKEMMETGGSIIIDVRTQEEYDMGYIENTVLSPVDNIENDIANITDDKDASLLVYCRSGNRSAVASNILVDLGYTNVYDFGGIVDWPYEIVQ